MTDHETRERRRVLRARGSAAAGDELRPEHRTAVPEGRQATAVPDGEQASDKPRGRRRQKPSSVADEE